MKSIQYPSCTLYMTTSSRDAITLTGVRANIELWHYGLRYMNEKGMKLCSKGKLSGLKTIGMKLCSKRKLLGLKTIGICLCENCDFGKQKRLSFSKTGRILKK